MESPLYNILVYFQLYFEFLLSYVCCKLQSFSLNLVIIFISYRAFYKMCTYPVQRDKENKDKKIHK